MIRCFRGFGFNTCCSDYSSFFGFRRKKNQLLKWVNLLDKWVIAYVKPNTENCDRVAENIGEAN